jgi:hypothetical protein
MNHQKLDAALATSLREIQDSQARTLVVFIHTEPELDDTAVAFLERLGVRGVTSGRQVFTATLSVEEIRELSEQCWVRVLRFSQKLRLADSK